MQEQVIEGYPLSPQQKRLWRSNNCQRPGRAVCTIGVEGKLDLSRLGDALRRIVNRHEALRTTLQSIEGMDVPLQVVREDAEIVICKDSLGRLKPIEPEAGSEQTRREQDTVNEGMEADSITCTVGELALDRFLVEIEAPAFCADPGTLANLCKELAAEYGPDSDSENEPGEVVQYPDYAEWQNELLEADGERQGTRPWERKEISEASNLVLPFELNSSSGFDSKTFEWTAPLDLVGGFDETARRLGADPAVALLTCWQILLWRWTAQPDVVVWNLSDGRGLKQLETAFGLFAKYLPVHVRLEEAFEYEGILGLVEKSIAEIYAHQDRFSWRAGGRPLETADAVAFDYLCRPENVRSNGATFCLVDLQSRVDYFKLRLSCARSARGLKLSLHYDPARYPTSTIARLAQGYEAVLNSVTASPAILVGEIDALGESERQQLEVWNLTERPGTLFDCFHDLVSVRAAETPDALAIACEDSQITFSEMERRSNQLSNYIRRRGVSVGSLVALLMERSPEMLIAALAILKAGAAYVSLDPGQPRRRLAAMLKDAGASAVLVHNTTAETLKEYGAEAVNIDAEMESIEAESVERPAVKVDGQSLAYVIFTSGSTGSPKGTMIAHQSVLNLIEGLEETVYAGLGRNARVSMNAPLTFDAAVKQIVQLANGRTLVIIPEAVRRDGATLAAFIRDHGIDVLDCTPSQLGLMKPQLAGLAAGRALVGGEAIDKELWRMLRESSGTRYFNVYGPTECTVDTSVAAIDIDEAPGIGRPIRNVRIHITDRGGRPVPIGAPGEICIGGAGVARGYLERADMTAEWFTPDPSSRHSGARLYRTGDAGRFLEDGSIGYIGRFDHQVKLRGYRIELGEIESVLKGHAGVEDAVVLAREDAPGLTRLVAYIVPKRGYGASGMDQGYLLPNGLRISHQNKNETDYLFEEIWEKQIYLRHGIAIPKDACVFDVGANIGMFSLFVSQQFENARIYAFEPLLPIFETLKRNAEIAGTRIKLFPFGLSDRETAATLTYYPRYSMMSGQTEYADANYEVEVIKQFLSNEQRKGTRGASSLLEFADELLDGRFESELYECRLRNLSNVIREEEIDRIDLLKIDVQLAEMDVLRGIEPECWEKIAQIVMEVHDRKGHASEGRIAEISGLLREKGFELTSEQDELLEGTDRYTLYAIQKGMVAETEPPRLQAPVLFVTESGLAPDDLRRYVKERLPDYMIPSDFVQIRSLPLTRNGKVDRRSLPAPEDLGESTEQAPLDALTPFEEMVAGIFRQVLRVAHVSVDDNFFDKGGHSLLATQLVSRVRETFGVDIPIRSLFESPTVSGLAQQVEIASRTSNAPESAPIEPAARDEHTPLSYAQQRLWFLSRLERDSALYNGRTVMRMTGRLNVAAIEQSVGEVVRRHESLRTVFAAENGRPVQVIRKAEPVGLPVIDLGGLPRARQEEITIELARQETRGPFDLSKGPLFRTRIVRLREDEHVMIVSMHHIISDGWSLGVMVREAGVLYKAFACGLASPMTELRIQYADFALWQSEWLKGERKERLLDYWKTQLAGTRHGSEVPADRPRPDVQTHNGATEALILPASLGNALQELSLQRGVTLFMTLLAAFKLLLHRYTGEEDVVVGTGIANRTRGETEDLIGFFVNMLVLRTDLSGEPSFVELLARVREVCLGAYAHQDLPMATLVESLRPERDSSRSPLFQTVFVVQNAPVPPLHLQGLTLSVIAIDGGTAPFDLIMSIIKSDEGPITSINYNTDLFDADTIRHLLSQYQFLLERIVENPNRRLLEFLLDEAGDKGQNRPAPVSSILYENDQFAF